MSSYEDKIEAFKKKGLEHAKAFQEKEVINGGDPSLADITAAFEKQSENEITLNGKTYTIEKFSPLRTLHLIPVLGKSTLVPIATAFKSMVGGKDGEGSFEDLPEAMYMLFENMESGQFQLLLELLLDNTTLRGKPVDLDKDFEDLGDVLKVCVKSLEINFIPFLESLGLGQMILWLQKISTLPQ